ncbi:MAG: hypothetical protein QM731_18195 [Chitinophagaceae bacterium]
MIAVQFIIYLVILLADCITGAVNYKALTAPFKALLVLLIITLVSESTSLYLAYTIKLSFPVYHVYVLLSFILYSIIFYLLFISNRVLRTIVVSTGIVFTLFSVSNSLFIQRLNSFPSYSILISSILLVLYALLFFGFLSGRDEDKKNWNSLIILNSAILLFFSVQIFNWGIYNYMLKKHISAQSISRFGYIISLIYYIALGCSIIASKKAVPKSEIA